MVIELFRLINSHYLTEVGSRPNVPNVTAIVDGVLPDVEVNEVALDHDLIVEGEMAVANLPDVPVEEPEAGVYEGIERSLRLVVNPALSNAIVSMEDGTGLQAPGISAHIFGGRRSTLMGILGEMPVINRFLRQLVPVMTGYSGGEEVALSVLVQTRNMGIVIGRGGVSIRKLELETRTRIRSGAVCQADSTERRVNIRGASADVMEAVFQTPKRKN